jgi:hypothetical protein
VNQKMRRKKVFWLKPLLPQPLAALTLQRPLPQARLLVGLTRQVATEV